MPSKPMPYKPIIRGVTPEPITKENAAEIKKQRASASAVGAWEFDWFSDARAACAWANAHPFSGPGTIIFLWHPVSPDGNPVYTFTLV
jgi:hypothetical protein